MSHHNGGGHASAISRAPELLRRISDAIGIAPCELASRRDRAVSEEELVVAVRNLSDHDRAVVLDFIEALGRGSRGDGA